MRHPTNQSVDLGVHIVSDPRICHGEPTFRGTRKLVRDCVALAATGLTIDELAERSNLPREATAEALQLAALTLQKHYASTSQVASARGYLRARTTRRAKR